MSEIDNMVHSSDCVFKSLLFNDLSYSDLEKLNKSKREIVFNKGKIIISEGHKIDEFIYLQKGLVKISKQTENQKDHIISIALPESFIGLLTVFSQRNYGYSITALKESTVCFIEIELIREFVLKNSTFAMTVLSKISKVSDEIIFGRLNISSRRLRGRIAYLLILFANEIFYNSTFILPITRREMGELIDMSTANVIRILSEFRKDKILNVEGSSIEILNFPLLEMVSKFG